MEINLTKDSIVDQRTGQIDTPSEYLDNLRHVEACIQRADEEIANLRADLKAARDAREKLVMQLRSGVREGKVLPLLEEIDGLDVDDATE